MLAILETTPGPPGWLRPAYRLYFRRLVPLLGRLIAGDASAYTYLPESTLAFVEPARLVAMLQSYGLDGVRTRPLMFGTVALDRWVQARYASSRRRAGWPSTRRLRLGGMLLAVSLGLVTQSSSACRLQQGQTIRGGLHLW